MLVLKNLVSCAGGTKKFLYTGAKRETAEEDQWTFAPKVQGNKPSEYAVWLLYNKISA